MYPGNRRSRRLWRWFLVWFFCTGAVIVVGLVIEQAVDPGWPAPRNSPGPAWGQPPPATRPPASAEPRPPARAESSPAGQPAPAGPLRVARGSRVVQGVGLGFPHSTAGAVSAAGEFLTAIDSTLDPDRAAAVMRLAADPAYASAPQHAAEGAEDDRRSLGLPASGPVPQGASVETEPAEYQVRDVTPDRVLVLLLCDFISTLPEQGTQTRTGVFPVPMHWAGGDWKVLPQAPGDYENLSAEPDSPQAASLGWQELEPAGG